MEQAAAKVKKDLTILREVGIMAISKKLAKHAATQGAVRKGRAQFRKTLKVKKAPSTRGRHNSAATQYIDR
jgi:hypothetical protein